jgi:hypothetical protein
MPTHIHTACRHARWFACARGRATARPCVRIGSGYDHSDAHPRRWYSPPPPRMRVCPCRCGRANAGGWRSPLRSPLGWAVRAVRYCHRRPRSGDAPARTRARWRRHGAEYPRAPCVRRGELRGGRAAHCARRCAQGSRTARPTPTTARRASRRSSPRRRAPVRLAYSAGGTMAV